MGQIDDNSIGVVRFDIALVSKESDFQIPANNRILDTQLEIITEYSTGTSIEIGKESDTDLLMENSINTPTIKDTYSKEQDTNWGASDDYVKATITGSPIEGAGYVLIKYVEPET